MRNLLFVFLIVLLSFNVIFANSNLGEVMTIDNQPYKNVILDSFDNDTLCVKSYGNTYYLPILKIKYLKYEKESHIGQGFIIGTLFGGFLGSTSGSPPNEDLSTFFSAVAGALIGGVIGVGISVISGNDNYYDIQVLNKKEKTKLINKIIKENQRKKINNYNY